MAAFAYPDPVTVLEVHADRAAQLAADAARASRAELNTGTVARPETKPRRAPVHIPGPKVQQRPVETAPAGGIATVLAYARAQIGKPYRWGAAGPAGFDCSGLIMAAFTRIGVRLPHSSGGIAGRGRAIPRSAWAPGTVLVWRGHVALYIGGNRMIHAPGRGRYVTEAAVYGSPQGRRLIG